MAADIYTFAIEVPPGTSQFQPQRTRLRLRPSFIRQVSIAIPSGHNGLTGIRLEVAGEPIIPWGGTTWVVGNAETVVWQVSKELGDGTLTVAQYNLGIYPHTHYIRILVEDIPLPRTEAVALTRPDFSFLFAPEYPIMPLPEV